MTSPDHNRRRVLRLLAALPALLHPGLVPLARAASALQVQPLADRLYLITGAGGNIVLHQGTDGLTLIDSGSAEHAGSMLELIDSLGQGAPLRRLINTHWHEDHTGGNEAARARGASIIAHENTRLWLGAEFEVHWRGQHFHPRPQAAWPDTTFYTSGELDLGGESLQYHHVEQAHTDGDLFLYFPAARVMVAGGLMTQRRYPITDIASGGWLGGLLNANKRMLEVADAAALVVPDRGPALTRADLQAQHDMLSELYTRMKAMAQDGFNGDDMLKAGVTADFDAQWGDPVEFVQESYRGMWAHTYDMGGFI